MRVLLSAAILFFPGACSTSTETDADQANVIDSNAELMDRIEKSVDLPQGASALNHYARYYAKVEDGHIRAIYLRPYEEKDPNDSCSRVGIDGELEDVPCPEPDVSYPILKSGQRIWLDDQENLPFLLDGGCQLVEVKYDSVTMSFESVRCNGEA